MSLTVKLAFRIDPGSTGERHEAASMPKMRGRNQRDSGEAEPSPLRASLARLVTD